MRRTSAGFGPGAILQQRRLAGGELDRVRRRLDERRDRLLHVLDPGEERALAEEHVVDRDVEAAAVGGEETIQPRRHAAPASSSVCCRSPTPSNAPTAVVASAPAAFAKRAQRSVGQPASRP